MKLATPLPVLLVLLAACNDSKLTAFNALPEASITYPDEGSVQREGYVVTFLGKVSDPDDPVEELTAVWYAGSEEICPAQTPESDGSVSCDIVLTIDDRDFTLEVQDPGLGTGTDAISLTIEATEVPDVSITSPEPGGTYYPDMLTTLQGEVWDAEDALDELVVWWESTLDGLIEADTEPDGNGVVTGFAYLSEGEHSVTLYAEDTTGKLGSDSVVVIVGPPNSAPDCALTEPEDGTVVEQGQSISFGGNATDPDVPPEWLAVRWSSDKDGDVGTSVPTSSGEVTFLYSNLSADDHVITMTVTDEMGAVCSDNVVVTVGEPPQLEVTSPTSGDTYNDGDLVTFVATVSDAEDSPNEVGLSWQSSLDGVFSTQSADSTGQAEFAYDSLSVGTHSVTVTATDTHGLYAEDLFTIIINGVPSEPSISLSPTDPDTDDELQVRIDATSVDPEGGAVSYSYEWYVDGVLSSASTLSSLPFSATSKGQTWSVQVTPSDGIADGPYAEASVTIGNAAPTVAGAAISPDPAGVDDTLLCSWSGFSDPDGDVDASTVAWTVDGTFAGSDTTLSGAFEKSEDVVCTVTPSDGEDTGTAVTAALTISNTTPSISSVSVSPDPATTDDTIVASVSDSDADGDAVTLTYTWYVDGTSTGTTGSTLDGATWFDRDQAVYVEVTPSDGTDTGPTVSSTTVSVLNSAPSATSVSITPTSASYSDALTATVSGWSDADGDPEGYAWEWTVDGTTITAATSSTLDASYTSPGSTVSVSVTPDDGTDTGSAVSTSITLSSTIDCGDGTVGVPVTSCAELDALADDLTETYCLTGDLDCTTYGDISTSGNFTGVFSGADYTITGLTGGPLFDTLSGELKNLDLAGVSTDWQAVASTVSASGSVTDVSIEGSVRRCAVVYENSGTLDGVSVDATVDGVPDGASDWKVGGVACTNYGTIVSSSFTGTISNGYYYSAGGITGLNNGTVQDCTVDADILDCYQYVGGVVGRNNGDVVACHSAGTIASSISFHVGGLVGYNSGSIDQSWSSVDVTGTDIVGGLVGGNDTSIQDSYAVGTVSGSEHVGGLIGYSGGDSSLDYAFAATPLSGTTGYVGGIEGNIGSSITSAYWDTDVGGSVGSSGTGLSTAQAVQEASYVGFDFTSVWTIDEGASYPCLQWQDPATCVYPDTIPPTEPVISITPSDPDPGEGLLCTIDSESTDADGDPITYTFTWDVDGTDASSLATTTDRTADTIPADTGVFDETWTCTVTPNDGTTDGTAASVSVTFSSADTGHRTCEEWLDDGYTDDGIYWIDPDGSSAGYDPVQTYCDQTNGGWTLIIHRAAYDDQSTCTINTVDAEGLVTSPDAASDAKLADVIVHEFTTPIFRFDGNYGAGIRQYWDINAPWDSTWGTTSIERRCTLDLATWPSTYATDGPTVYPLGNTRCEGASYTTIWFHVGQYACSYIGDPYDWDWRNWSSTSATINMWVREIP